MNLRPLVRRVLHAVARLVPRRLRTRAMAARLEVDSLSEEQRERLRRNLKSLVVPKAA